MNSDATEAALGLLGLSPQNAAPPRLPTPTQRESQQVIPLKRKQPSHHKSHPHHLQMQGQSLLMVPNLSRARGHTFTNIISNKNGSNPTTDESTFNPDAINCICGFLYDDGFSIACDDCERWCHAACFDIIQGEVPEEWRCWVCVPRAVDRDRAVKLQKARQRAAEIEQRQQQRDVMQREKDGRGVDVRERVSPGAEKKVRRASAAAIDGGKKRRRTSIIQPQHPQQPQLPQPQSQHPQQPAATTEDEDVNIDEPWTHSYVPITKDIIPLKDTRDKLTRHAQHWRGVTAIQQSPPPTSIRPLPKSSLSQLSHSNPSVRPPAYAMHTTTPIPSAHFIAPYTSTIVPSSTYLSDPLNAYAHLGMPKPFVHLLGHPLDVTLDSRIAGDKARFVRSGCRPNAALRPVLCSKAKHDRESPETLSFGVFALRDLKANEEVVLGWEWDDGNAIHALPALIENPHTFPALSPSPSNSPHQLEYLRAQMAGILHALSSTFTTCACGAKAKDCALAQMEAFVDREVADAAELRSEEGKVDLGPLVGATRGFKTRERVPMSGGMSGVEMDVEESEQVEEEEYIEDRPVAGPSRIRQGHERKHTVGDVALAFRESTFNPQTDAYQSPKAKGKKPALPMLTLSPATSPPSALKNKDRKGKGRESDEEDEIVESEEGEGMHGGLLLSPSLRRNKRARRHVTIDIDPSPSSPLRHRHLHPLPDDDDLMQHVPEEDEVEEIVVVAEEKMPPKMRKRWIHHSVEVLKESLAHGTNVGGDEVGKDGEDIDVDIGGGEEEGMHEDRDDMRADAEENRDEIVVDVEKMKVDVGGDVEMEEAALDPISIPAPIAPPPAPVFHDPVMPIPTSPLATSVSTPTPTLSSTPTAIPTKSMPASTLSIPTESSPPRTVSFAKSQPRARTNSPFDNTNHNISSPSTSFAKMSLMSPAVDGVIVGLTLGAHHPAPDTSLMGAGKGSSGSGLKRDVKSPSPLGQNGHTEPQTLTLVMDSQELEIEAAEKLEDSREPENGPVEKLIAPDVFPPRSPVQEAESPTAEESESQMSPHPLESLPPLERKLVAVEPAEIQDSPESPDPHTDGDEDVEDEGDDDVPATSASASVSASEPVEPSPRSPSPERLNSPSSVQEPERTSSPTPTPSPPPPPPPPPPTKVKMSLKDFALRKKKQREEEMAKAASAPAPESTFSPGSTHSALEAGSSASPRMNGLDLQAPDEIQVAEVVRPREGAGTEDKRAEMNASAETSDGMAINGDADRQLHIIADVKEKLEEIGDAAVNANAMVVDPQEKPADKAAISAANGAANIVTREPSSPTIHFNKPLTRSPSPSRSIHQNDDSRPQYSNGVDSRSAKSEIMDTPLPASKYIPDKPARVKELPAEPFPRPLNGNRNNAVTIDRIRVASPGRRLSHEDGEITAFTPPKQPSLFVPRAHTPPTQPRSFHLPPTSPNSVSAPAPSQPRRPSQPPLSRPHIPSSRPPPIGPRALRTHLGSPAAFPSNRSLSGPQFIPRGPSADRDRIDWDRDRNWSGPGRARGRGGGGWGR